MSESGNGTKTLELWEVACKTDTAWLKHVNQKGGYHAIDAHYQVFQATRVWGPMGIAWAWKVEYEILQVPNAMLVVCHGTLVYPGGHLEGITTACELFKTTEKGGRTDTDAWKKARTDGLTKALSQLGFAADVFMGLHDADRARVSDKRKDLKRLWGMDSRDVKPDNEDNSQPAPERAESQTEGGPASGEHGAPSTAPIGQRCAGCGEMHHPQDLSDGLCMRCQCVPARKVPAPLNQGGFAPPQQRR